MKWIAFLVLAACAGAQRIPTATDELAPLREQWVTVFNAKDLDGVMATYTLDAVFLPITGNRIVSAMAIRQLFVQTWRTFTPRITLDSRIAERTGDLAYDSGSYQEVLLSREARLEITGQYLFIYRREGGVWKIAQQVWTEAPPAQSSVEPAGPASN